MKNKVIIVLLTGLVFLIFLKFLSRLLCHSIYQTFDLLLRKIRLTMYLKGQKLIRWHRNDNIIVSPALYPEKEEEILEDLKIIL